MGGNRASTDRVKPSQNPTAACQPPAPTFSPIPLTASGISCSLLRSDSRSPPRGNSGTTRTRLPARMHHRLPQLPLAQERVSGLADRATNTGKPQSADGDRLPFLLRYALLAAAAYAILTSFPASLRGLLAGLFLPVAAIACEAGLRAIRGNDARNCSRSEKARS